MEKVKHCTLDWRSMGGAMPAWGEVLNTEQRLAVIAGFQSYWTPQIYDLWLEREQASRE